MRCPYDQDAEAPFEKGYICDDNDGLRAVVMFLCRGVA